MHDVIVIYVGAFVELTRGQPFSRGYLDCLWKIKTTGSIPLIQCVPPLMIITGCGATLAFIGKGKGYHGKLVKYR